MTVDLKEVETFILEERRRMDDRLETLQLVIDQIRAMRGEVRHKAKIVCDLLNNDPMLREREYIRGRLK